MHFWLGSSLCLVVALTLIMSLINYNAINAVSNLIKLRQNYDNYRLTMIIIYDSIFTLFDNQFFMVYHQERLCNVEIFPQILHTS